MWTISGQRAVSTGQAGDWAGWGQASLSSPRGHRLRWACLAAGTSARPAQVGPPKAGPRCHSCTLHSDPTPTHSQLDPQRRPHPGAHSKCRVPGPPFQEPGDPAYLPASGAAQPLDCVLPPAAMTVPSRHRSLLSVLSLLLSYPSY